MKNKWEKNYPNFAKTVEKRGLKLEFIAGSAGLTYGQLYRRLTNASDFELPVMKKLAKNLGETMDYLFA